jgi:dTDP-4-amino-4,6-dideoxygalactose transaminase
MYNIPFNKPYITGRELSYIVKAHSLGVLAGDGVFSERCSAWIEQHTGVKKVLLTHSCTGALEMCALLLAIAPGDEVIMPSYTFASTANAFVLRGAVPVFVDIRPDTLNIDENLVESAITASTKAIVAVHYAGVSAGMSTLLEIGKRYNIPVIEDAAQGINSSIDGRALGSMGTFGTLSFHETKNVISGQGGALLINEPKYIERAEIIREKGTNRSRYFRGEVDKYTWEDVGSSFLPGELVAAFLWAQMQETAVITSARLRLWSEYYSRLERLEAEGLLRRPFIPTNCTHNAHMFYVLVKSPVVREHVINHLRAAKIHAVFHYVPLHSSPAGVRFGRAHGSMHITDHLSSCIIRLPLWVGLEVRQICGVVHELETCLRTLGNL